MIVGNKHNQPKARPKDNEKKKKLKQTKFTHLTVKEKKKKQQQQHNLVLQITIRNQYTINIPPTT